MATSPSAWPNIPVTASLPHWYRGEVVLDRSDQAPLNAAQDKRTSTLQRRLGLPSTDTYQELVNVIRTRIRRGHMALESIRVGSMQHCLGPLSRLFAQEKSDGDLQHYPDPSSVQEILAHELPAKDLTSERAEIVHLTQRKKIRLCYWEVRGNSLQQCRYHWWRHHMPGTARSHAILLVFVALCEPSHLVFRKTQTRRKAPRRCRGSDQKP